MPPSLNTNPRSQSAFTLVELLVSMALLIVLVGMLAQMMNHASQAWNLGESNKQRMQDVRAVTEFIANELQCALLPINRTTPAGLQFVVNPSTASSYNSRDSIFWQMPLAANRAKGDVAEVGYFVRWDETTNSTNPRPLLCRFYADPTDTTNFLIYSSPNNWLGVIDDVAPGIKSTDSTKNYKGLFAENVLGLWADCLDSAGQKIDPSPSPKFDSRIGYTDSILGKRTACALPVSVDLGLVMLDSKSAQRINTGLQSKISALIKTGTNAQDFVANAQKDGSLKPIVQGLRYYQTRIYLQNSK